VALQEAQGGEAALRAELAAAREQQEVMALENARLFAELQERNRELAEALERQTATGQVLEVISRSTRDVRPVFETVVEHAIRLCGADGGQFFRLHGDVYRVEVASGGSDDYHALLARSPVAPGRGTLVGKVALERRAVRIPDVLVDAEYRWREAQQLGGFRTLIGVPLLKDEAVLGVIILWRREARPFTDHQMQLVTSFADQAVIALENTRLFTELEEKGQQLEVASRHKSEFLATMSHELRTPLNAINGFSEVLLERYFGDLNDKQEEYLNDILSSGRHLLSLISDILDLSKVEAGRMELEPSRFPLAPLLESGLVMVRERASRNGVLLGLDVSPEVGEIEADERKVKQVLFNLLSNAVKFTPPGGRVDVAARSAREGVEITVRDTGTGIAAEDQGRIFEAFRQARPGKDHGEGTGLGLALTRRLVELHGGRIGVESVPGTGSTFTVALPRRPTPVDTPEGQPAGA
jgi:signal transduction histidine kinase